MWNTLIDEVVSKIQTSNEIDSDYVYSYRKSETDGYPMVTVSPSDNVEPLFADTGHNHRTYVFSIVVWQEMINQKPADAERILRTIADDLIEIFDNDIYLNNTLKGKGFVRPVPSRFLPPPDEGEGPNVMGLEILLQALVRTAVMR